MPKLLQLMHDQDASCRSKALLALSCLIRLNPLALEVFRQKRGVPQLVDAASDQDTKVHSKYQQSHIADAVIEMQASLRLQESSALAAACNPGALARCHHCLPAWSSA